MGPQRQLPGWAWWVIGIAVIAAIAGGVAFIVHGRRPVLPPGLAERRADAARILEASSRVEDVDIQPLLTLETKKDYQGAVALMEQAIAVNATQEELTASLRSVSEELRGLAANVRPDETNVKATQAFQALVDLAGAQQKFYADRRTLYEVTKAYYTDLAAKKHPAIPDNLRSLVAAINEDRGRVNDLNRQFSAAIGTFDAALTN